MTRVMGLAGTGCGGRVVQHQDQVIAGLPQGAGGFHAQAQALGLAGQEAGIVVAQRVVAGREPAARAAHDDIFHAHGVVHDGQHAGWQRRAEFPGGGHQ